MQQAPGMGGKAAAPQGKAGAPQGKGAAPQGKGGQQGGQGPAPMVPSSASGAVSAPGGMVPAQRAGTETQGKPGFPIFSPMAQGFQGASASQQNPNEGGASTSPSAISSPSTEQGGMGA